MSTSLLATAEEVIEGDADSDIFFNFPRQDPTLPLLWSLLLGVTSPPMPKFNRAKLFDLLAAIRSRMIAATSLVGSSSFGL